MDMMVTEEVRVSTDGPRGNNGPVINQDTGSETVSDPGDKFQKAITAWRGVFKLRACLFDTRWC